MQQNKKRLTLSGLSETSKIGNHHMILHHGTRGSVAKAIANIVAVLRRVNSCAFFPANHNGFCNWIEPR